jgi:hypothetical protein
MTAQFATEATDPIPLGTDQVCMEFVTTAAASALG